MPDSKTPLTRALGYLIEGGTGLIGLAGAGPAASEITPLIFNVPNIDITLIQQGVNLLFSIAISVVTLWRMVKPKKAILIPPDGSTVTPAVVLTPSAPATPQEAINPVPPPPDFKNVKAYSEPEQ